MRKTTLAWGSFLVLALGGSAFAGTAQLLTNGGFESPAIAANSFIQQPTIPGWSGSEGVEIQSNEVLGPGNATPFGHQYAELNVESLSTLSQSVDTTTGQHYNLSFDFAARPGTGSNSVRVGFTGNDSQVFTLPASTTVSFHHYSLSLIGDGSHSVLSFAPLTPNILGAGDLLDNVSLTAAASPPTSVPLPAGAWSGFAMLGGLGAFFAVRHRRSVAR